MRPLPLFAALCLLASAACAAPPVLRAAGEEAGERFPIPRLQPIAPLLATADALAAPGAPAGTEGEAAPETEAEAAARAEALRERADALRGPVIEDSTRARLAEGVTLPPTLAD